MPISAQRSPTALGQARPGNDGKPTAGGASSTRAVFGALHAADGGSFPINSSRWSVGRAPGNDLVVKSRSVSADHAVFEAGADGVLSLRDRGSRNGTFVNDTHLNGNGVAEAHAALVRTGDYVRFGYDVEVYQYCGAGESLQPPVSRPVETLPAQRSPQPEKSRPDVSSSPPPEPVLPSEPEPEPEPVPVSPPKMVDAAVEPLRSSTDLDEIRAEITRAAGTVRDEIERQSNSFIEELGRQGDRTRDVLSKTAGGPEPEAEPASAPLPPMSAPGGSNWLPNLTEGDLKHRSAMQPNPLFPLSLPRAVLNRPPPLPHLQRVQAQALSEPGVPAPTSPQSSRSEQPTVDLAAEPEPAPIVQAPAAGQLVAGTDSAAEPAPAQPSVEAKEMFEQLDVDGDGLIDGEELREAVEQLGLDTDDAMVKEMLEQADADGDGKISLQEFAEVEEVSAATRGSSFQEAVKLAEDAARRVSRAAHDARKAADQAESAAKQQAAEEIVRREEQQALDAENKAIADAQTATQAAKVLHAKRAAATKARAQRERLKTRRKGMPTPSSASASADLDAESGSPGVSSISVDREIDNSQPQSRESIRRTAVEPQVQEARRLSGDFKLVERSATDDPSMELSPEISRLNGISTDSLPPMREANSSNFDSQVDLATSMALQEAIKKAEAAASASEKAAQESAAGHRQAELAAAWIQAELEVVQALESDTPSTGTKQEVLDIKRKLAQVEKERDAMKARATRYKSEVKKAQKQGSSDREMLQEELDDANRMIAAAMSGDTDGVVEEMKQQRDAALELLHKTREERDALVGQLVEHARGHPVPSIIVDAAKEQDPAGAVLQAVLQLQHTPGMQSPEMPDTTAPPLARTIGDSGTALDEANHRAEALDTRAAAVLDTQAAAPRTHSPPVRTPMAAMAPTVALERPAVTGPHLALATPAAAVLDTQAAAPRTQAAEQVLELNDSRAKTQQLAQQLKDNEKLLESLTADDTGRAIAEMQKQLADSNAAATAAQDEADQTGSAFAELRKVHEATAAEVSNLQAKLQAAGAELEGFRGAAGELKALAARRAEMSPRETPTSPEQPNPIMSPRQMQTSPEVIMSPRTTQTSPKPTTQTKWVSLIDPRQIVVDLRATRATETFKKLDTDGDGLIDGDELNEAVQELDLDTDQTNVAALVERTTAADDGTKVSLAELIEIAQPVEHQSHQMTPELETEDSAAPSTVKEGDRVKINCEGKWLPGIVENVDQDSGEAEVRFDAQSPRSDETDALRSQLAAAQRQLEEYRIAASKLPIIVDTPPVGVPTPVPTNVPPLVPRLENLPTPIAVTPAVTAAAQEAVNDQTAGMPPLPTPRSTGEETAALKQMQDQMSTHFIELKNQVEKMLAIKEGEMMQPTETVTTPRGTQTLPEPTKSTTPRDTQTSPEPQSVNTPRSTQTSPEPQSVNTPRSTQTSPEPPGNNADKRAKEIFQQVDTDGDGLIDGNELKQAIQQLGLGTDHAKVTPLVERTIGGTGSDRGDAAKVSLKEFVDMFDVVQPDKTSMSPRETQTTPEQKPIMSPRETETSPQPEPEPDQVSVDQTEVLRLRDALVKHGLELEQMRAASAEQAEKLRVATESLASMKPRLEAASRAEKELQQQLDHSHNKADQLGQQVKHAESLLEAATSGDTGGIVAEMQKQSNAATAEIDRLNSQTARDKAALDAANLELVEVRAELDRLQGAAETVVPKLVGIPGSEPEPVASPPREWRSPNSTMRSPERTPPRLRWTPRGEQAKKMEDRLKSQLKQQREQTEKLHIKLAETENLIDAAMAGHTDEIIKKLHDQLKISRDEASESELKAQEARDEAAEAQRRIEAQLTRIAALEANQLVHTDGQTQTSDGDVLIKADEYVRLDHATEAVQTGITSMHKQCAEALRDLAVWRATAAGQDPQSASIPQFDFDTFGSSRDVGLVDRLEQMIVPAMTRVPLDTLQRTLADVIREHQERDSYDINSMPWSVLRDYAITQRQRIEALADENRSLSKRWADEHNDPSTAAAQIATLRSQLACKDAELYAIRGDLARFLQPTSASKDDGNDELTGDDGHRQKLEARYQKVVQAERALEERTRREHSARRKWSGLLQERASLAQQVQNLECAVQTAERAHERAAAQWDASMRSTRLELAHIAAGGTGDPRRQAAELLVAQLHTADRAVSEAQSLCREEARRASRLEVELAALRQAEGLTAWGDGVAAQREHMAALRDEIMELRTLLGPAQVEENTAERQLNGPQVLSVQDLQRLCQSYASQLESKSKLVAAMESERARLKEGVIESTEAGAIDHYTPILAVCESEVAELREAISDVTASRDAMAKRHPPAPATAAAAAAPKDQSGAPG